MHQALASCFLAAVRAAAGDRFTGDHAHHALLGDHTDRVHVRVERPGHGLRVRTHVGRGDVVIRADVRPERVEETPRNAAQLGTRHAVRVELDAAFAAAEGQIHQRALPGHHRTQCFEVIQRSVLVVTHPALVRAKDVRVLDAVALEYAVLTAIHAHWKVNDDFVLRLAQNAADVLRHLNQLGRVIQIILDDLEEFVFGSVRGGRGVGRYRLHASYCSSNGGNPQKGKFCFAFIGKVGRLARSMPYPDPQRVKVHDGSDDDQRVDAVQHSAVTGHDRAGIFDARGALQE